MPNRGSSWTSGIVPEVDCLLMHFVFLREYLFSNPQVLLDKGVKEERILFLSLIAAPEGVQKVCSRFPLLKVVTSEIDQCVDDMFQVRPGIGEFGDRYFCD